MKAAAVVLVLALAAVLGWTAWGAWRELQAEVAQTRAALEALGAERDAALDSARAALAVADSLDAAADSLVAELDRRERSAAARIEAASAEADSLGNALKSALDSLGAPPDTLRVVVERMLTLNSRLRAEYEAHVTLADSVVAALRAEGDQKALVIARQTEAIGLGLERERVLEAAWERAVNPGWLDRVFRDVKVKAGVAVVSFALGSVISR